jgi:hypothetical protein
MLSQTSHTFGYGGANAFLQSYESKAVLVDMRLFLSGMRRIELDGEYKI